MENDLLLRSSSQSLGQNDSDLICDLGVESFSTLTLHGADDTIRATSSATNKEAKEKKLSKEEKEELDRKKREYFVKKLLPGYEESESDEDIKLTDASFQCVVKRCYAKTMKMMKAKMKLDIESHLNEMKEEELKYQSLMMKKEKQIPKTYYY